jgi:fructose-bisphosphate aldolase class 1
LRQRIGADRAADKVGLVPIVEPEVLMDGEVGDLDDLVEFWRRH